jgi:hypothetical protein
MININMYKKIIFFYNCIIIFISFDKINMYKINIMLQKKLINIICTFEHIVKKTKQKRN